MKISKYLYILTFFFLTHGLIAQMLPIPAVAAGQSNNYFIAGTGDGNTLTTYNSFLRLHNGLAIGSPYARNASGGYVEKATILFDGRSGTINTLGSFSAIGSLGIGTLTPASKLQIVTSNAREGMQLNHNNQNWVSFYSPSLTASAFNGITGANDAGIIFGGPTAAGDFDYGFIIAPHNNSTSGLRITNIGNILIGKSSQANNVYKLDVNGVIRSNEIVVNTTGADFVFSDAYQLRPLAEVNEFIKTNKHLPEIPSAEEMQTNGV